MEATNGAQAGVQDFGAVAFDDEEFEDDDLSTLLFDYEEFDDDEETAYYDDDEIIGGLLGSVVPGVIGAGVKAVSNLVSGGNKRKKVVTRPPHQYGQYVRGKSPTAVIPTRNGSIRAQISGKFVSPDQLQKALAAVRADIARVKTEVKTVDTNARQAEAKLRTDVTKSIAEQDRANKLAIKKQERNLRLAEARLTKKLSGVRETMLLMTLMNRPPEIDQLTVNPGMAAGDTTLNVTGTSFKSSNNILPLMLMMGDGFGGGSSGGDSSNLLLVLALSGGL